MTRNQATRKKTSKPSNVVAQAPASAAESRAAIYQRITDRIAAAILSG